MQPALRPSRSSSSPRYPDRPRKPRSSRRLILSHYVNSPACTAYRADIKGKPTFAENLKENPIAPIGYAFSLLICMSAALSLPGGAGLGTMGIHEQKAREMTAAAGFNRFRPIDYEVDILNAYYEIRP